jgi:hypothetical protein
MAVTKPRNRLVIFRLTQEEYQQLETVSAAGGARSLSEFARSRVLNGAGGEPSLTELKQKLDELAGAVEGLTRMLKP